MIEQSMKVFINRKPVSGPYGGGNLFVKAFYQYSIDHEIQLVDNPEDDDVYFLVGFDKCDINHALQAKKQNPKTKLIARINENDARKATTHVDPMLIDLSKYLDATVFVSNWLQSYFKQWHCVNNTVIINGVDNDVFCPSDNKLSTHNNKINIVAHHWSDNRLKGADIYEKIDKFVADNFDDYAFTYIGRHKCEFTATRIVNPLFGKNLGEELNRHDVYVSASVADPGPNHISESIACGLPTYVHVNGGGCVEFAGDDHIYHDWDELKDILLMKPKPNKTKFAPWQECIEQYVRYFDEINCKIDVNV